MTNKVYAIVSYDLLEYVPSMCVHKVYSTREAAERNLPESDDMLVFEIKEWEVLDD